MSLKKYITLAGFIGCMALGLMQKSDIAVMATIIAFIGYLLYALIVPKSKLRSTNKSSSNEADQVPDDPEYWHLSYYQKSVLVLLANVMNVDGEQSDREMKRVKATIKRYFKTEEEQKTAMTNFETVLKKKAYNNLDKYIESIRSKVHYPAARSEIIMELLAVAYADNIVHDDEIIRIREISEKLVNQNFSRIHTIFKKKFEQGFYDVEDDQESAKYDRKKDEADMKYYILVLVGEVMKADKKRTLDELENAKSTISRLYETEAAQQAALRELQEILSKDHKIDEICKEIVKIDERADIINMSDIMMELLAIIYTDGKSEGGEGTVLQEIVTNLKISTKRYEGILRRFWRKQQQQNSNKSKSDQSYRLKEDGYDVDDEEFEYKESEEFDDSFDFSNSKKSKKEKSRRMSVQEALDILGVAGNASNEEIKKAYRALAKEYHPDNAAKLGDDEAMRQTTETMKQINMAWKVVKEERGMK